MEQHFTLTDQEFEARFSNATLDPAVFSHEAHLRLAWIHIHQYGQLQAVKNIRLQLQQYVKHAGATGKYNETLTIAAVKVVNHFIQKEAIPSFHAFITTYPRLKYNFKEIIAQHYGFDIFNSEKAKSEYLEPDLLSFS